MSIRTLVGAWLAPLALSPLAAANIYTVGPGASNFNDIQPAILASLPGDVLWVQPGVYGPFALDRGLTIVGHGFCHTSGPITIAAIPAGQTAVMIDVLGTTLDIQGCLGPVIVQDIANQTPITVQSSIDVRFARISMANVTADFPAAGMVLDSSRVELVESSVHGQSGSPCSTPVAFNGNSGIRMSYSRAHIVRSTIRGGDGTSCNQMFYMNGGGGDGIYLFTSSDLILCGRTTDLVQGGAGGYNPLYLDCAYDGGAAPGVELEMQSFMRWSSVTILGYDWYSGHQCIPYHVPEVVVHTTSSYSLLAIADPTLVATGSPSPGGQMQFQLDAPPGSSAILYFGRNAILASDPNIEIERLTPASRTVNLGTIGGTGQASFTWPIAGMLPVGTRLIAQAQVTLPGGEIRRTNSVPVILR